MLIRTRNSEIVIHDFGKSLLFANLYEDGIREFNLYSQLISHENEFEGELDIVKYFFEIDSEITIKDQTVIYSEKAFCFTFNLSIKQAQRILQIALFIQYNKLIYVMNEVIQGKQLFSAEMVARGVANL